MQTEISVIEGMNFNVCLQLTGSLQEPVVVNITATPGTAEGKVEERVQPMSIRRGASPGLV